MRPNVAYGPWTGYQSSVPRHRVGRDKLAVGSFDWVLDPLEGKWIRRKGTAVAVSAHGITYRARQLVELFSPALTDEYPTHCVIYTTQSGANGFVYFLSTNSGGSHQWPGKSFGVTHYPANFKMVPLKGTDGSYNRCSTAAAQEKITGLSRRMLSVGGWLILPAAGATPWRWSQDFNDTAGAGTRNERIFPLGHIPPLWPSTVVAGAQAPDNVGAWDGGDYFYVSAIFERDDGSRSGPMIPRAKNSDLPSGFGLVGPLGGTTLLPGQKTRSVTVSNIPIGPEGTKRRILLRTPKEPGAAPVNPLDLRIWEIVDNNTETTITSTRGDDSELVADDSIVRFDGIWPLPSHYVWDFDGRIAFGYAQSRNPAQIILAPQQNNNDETPGATVYEFDAFAADLALLKLFKGANVTDFGILTWSMQKIVDQINATTDTGTNGGKWNAQLAPGADPNQIGTYILRTDAGAGTGDNTNHVRAFSNAYPAVLHVLGAPLYQTASGKRQVWFTMGGPGMPPYAADSFSAKNMRQLPDAAGFVQGGAPLLDGCIVPYTKAIGILRNIRDGKTGQDDDYRLEFLNATRGCIAWGSIVHGDGWVGYLTAEGYVVTDGAREVIISGDVWRPPASSADPTLGVGDWGYEIQQCLVSAARDDAVTPPDTAQFHARVMGGKLYVTFRASGASTFPNRMMIYDFTPSIGRSGLAEVLRPDGTPWGWDTPMRLGLSVLGEVHKSDGLRRYGAFESSQRVDQFETGTTDQGGAAIVPVGYCATDDLGTRNKKSLANLVAVYKKTSSTGLSLTASRDKARTSQVSVALAASGASDIYTRKVITPRQSLRAPAEVIELGFTDSGTGSNDPEMWSIEAEVEVLDSPV